MTGAVPRKRIRLPGLEEEDDATGDDGLWSLDATHADGSKPSGWGWLADSVRDAKAGGPRELLERRERSLSRGVRDGTIRMFLDDGPAIGRGEAMAGAFPRRRPGFPAAEEQDNGLWPLNRTRADGSKPPGLGWRSGSVRDTKRSNRSDLLGRQERGVTGDVRDRPTRDFTLERSGSSDAPALSPATPYR
jgi:hypothetical protein